MILITTVWHSGTNSLGDMLIVDHAKRGIEWEQRHCDRETVEMARSGLHDVHTTLRDPYHVAISWANRGRIDDRDKWFLQWACWAEIAPLAIIHRIEDLAQNLNSYPDKLNLYESIGTEEYYKHIPRDMIDYAIECIKPYR